MKNSFLKEQKIYTLHNLNNNIGHKNFIKNTKQNRNLILKNTIKLGQYK